MVVFMAGRGFVVVVVSLNYIAVQREAVHLCAGGGFSRVSNSRLRHTGVGHVVVRGSNIFQGVKPMGRSGSYNEVKNIFGRIQRTESYQGLTENSGNRGDSWNSSL